MRMSLAFLPNLFTLGNALCGFAAVVKLSMVSAGGHISLVAGAAEIRHAAILILIAMVFDALDGHVARLVRKTSDFGGQLDSLSDAVSFGVAPALAVVVTATSLSIGGLWPRVVWLLAASYCAATLLRLARFNVDNAHDEGSHLFFEGLPSPAAAGVVASLLLVSDLLVQGRGQRLATGIESVSGLSATAAVFVTLPFVAFALAALMVSNVRYIHVFQIMARQIRRDGRWRRSGVSPGTAAGVVLLLLVVWPELTIAAVFCGCAASGPLLLIGRGALFVGRPSSDDAPEDSDESLPHHRHP